MPEKADAGSQWPGYILDYDALESIAESRADEYAQGTPFPHIVLDDFLPAWAVSRLAKEFPEPDPTKQRSDNTSYYNKKPVQLNKVGIQSEAYLKDFPRHLLWELNSQRFLAFLEKLTRIGRLIADPLYRGGGLHQTKPGGFLEVHVDFNVHPVFKLDRRLNVLIYANEGWQDSWGGDIELWTRDAGQCVKKISPIAGRCVIFSTSSNSWHGHPSPVACPEGNTRKSVALYYYTNGRPAHEVRPAHKVLWGGEHPQKPEDCPQESS